MSSFDLNDYPETEVRIKESAARFVSESLDAYVDAELKMSILRNNLEELLGYAECWIQESVGFVMEDVAWSDESFRRSNRSTWLSDLADCVARALVDDKEASRFCHRVEETYEYLNPDVDCPDGYVYLLTAGPYTKIGRSESPDNRIETLKIQLPFPVEVAAVFPCSNHAAVEKALHTEFSDYRANGEWFQLPDWALERLERAAFGYVESTGRPQLLEEIPRRFQDQQEGI